MFENIKKTELIIVCDKKRMPYAKHLIQLLGKNDDTKENIIGTKDGSVSAAIYTEKQYSDSLSKISSNTHVLFIGKNSSTKDESAYMDYKIDCFGMKFGWQGKHAVMYVDKAVKKDEYDNFIIYANSYQLEFKNKNSSSNTDTAKWVLLPFISASATIFKAGEEIKEKQYRCLTIVTYLSGLQDFLEA